MEDTIQKILFKFADIYHARSNPRDIEVAKREATKQITALFNTKLAEIEEKVKKHNRNSSPLGDTVINGNSWVYLDRVLAIIEEAKK